MSTIIVQNGYGSTCIGYWKSQDYDSSIHSVSEHGFTLRIQWVNGLYTTPPH